MNFLYFYITIAVLLILVGVILVFRSLNKCNSIGYIFGTIIFLYVLVWVFLFPYLYENNCTITNDVIETYELVKLSTNEYVVPATKNKEGVFYLKNGEKEFLKLNSLFTTIENSDNPRVEKRKTTWGFLEGVIYVIYLNEN